MDNKPQDQEPLKELTPELMAGYANGTLSPEEREQVEQFLRENDFEAEAVAGLEATTTDLSEDLMELESRLAEKIQATSKPVTNRYWPVAAAISVMLIAGFLFYYLKPLEPIPSQVSYVDDSATVTGNQQPAIVESNSGIDKDQAESTTSAKTEQIDSDTRDKIRDAQLAETVEEAMDDTPATRDLAEASSKTLSGDLSEDLSEDLPEDQSEVLSRDLSGASSEAASRTSRPTTTNQGVSAARSIEPSRRVAAAENEDTEAISEVDNIATEDAAPVVFRNETKKEKASKSLTSAEGIPTPELPRASPPTNIKDYITQHLSYPEDARRQDIQGIVKLRFLVDQDGRLSDFQVISGPGHGCEQEAIRVLEMGPAWIPAKINGSPVLSKGEIEIQFPTRD